MKRERLHLDTRAIHAGEPEPRVAGAVSAPIFQSATFEYGGRVGGPAASRRFPRAEAA